MNLHIYSQNHVVGAGACFGWNLASDGSIGELWEAASTMLGKRVEVM